MLAKQRSRGKCCCLVVALLASSAWCVRGAELYVAPNGSDANPGTRERPFATLERARDAVRDIRRKVGVPKEGITVWLRDGTYELKRTLAFTTDDSGAAGSPIVFRAVEGEDVWLSGGSVAPSAAFKPVTDKAVLSLLPPEARGHVLQVSLEELDRLASQFQLR
jgi:hypothetical protein